MTTQVVEQPKDLRGPRMNTTAATFPEEAPEAGRIPGAGVDIYLPVPRHRERLLSRMIRALVTFHDWLSRPPMSQRQRDEQAIAQWEFDWKHERYLYH